MSMSNPVRDPPADTDPALPVLIVDDSRAQRRLLARTLSGWGYETIEASSGEEALTICGGVDIDLVVSDWLMPGMSGIEFCRAFRAIKKQRPAYFILLTAQTERQRLAEGLESGADDFLFKPFNMVELKARLRAGERVIAAHRSMIAKNRLLKKTLDELEDAHAAIERDLREARNFQQALVPERFVSVAGADISLLYRPSGHVGGDLVGMFRVEEGRIGVYAIDVAGHGIASALMTARIAGYLSASSPEQNLALEVDEDGRFSMLPPDEVCHRLNRRLVGEFELDKYLTMVLADIDLKTGRIVMAQAGHPSPLVQRRGGRIEYIESYGMPVGLIEEATYSCDTIVLEAGDRLVLYSDGLTECPSPNGQLLEEAGLSDIVRKGADLHGPAFVEHLTDELITYAGTEDFPDDLSALIVEMAT